jgi:hypothetical protein
LRRGKHPYSYDFPAKRFYKLSFSKVELRLAYPKRPKIVLIGKKVATAHLVALSAWQAANRRSHMKLKTNAFLKAANSIPGFLNHCFSIKDFVRSAATVRRA